MTPAERTARHARRALLVAACASLALATTLVIGVVGAVALVGADARAGPWSALDDAGAAYRTVLTGAVAAHLGAGVIANAFVQRAARCWASFVDGFWSTLATSLLQMIGAPMTGMLWGDVHRARAAFPVDVPRLRAAAHASLGLLVVGLVLPTQHARGVGFVVVGAVCLVAWPLLRAAVHLRGARFCGDLARHADAADERARRALPVAG